MTVRRFTGLVGCLLVAVVMAGCAALPGSGQVWSISNNGANQGVSRVWTYAQAPTPGETPYNIVTGFLEALASDETSYTTAKKYLTTESQASWRPTAETDIVDNAEHVQVVVGSDTQFVFAGAWLGMLNSAGYYSHPGASEYRQTIDVMRENGEWRISDPPPGVVLDQIDFQRIYGSPYSLYYPDPLAPDSQLVPCQVYLRNQSGLLTALTQAFFAADCPTLENATEPLLPTNAVLAAGAGPTVDSENATIVVTNAAARLSPDAREQVLGALYWTLQQIGVTEVTLTTQGGGLTVSVTNNSAAADRYASVGDTTAPAAYYLHGSTLEQFQNGRSTAHAFNSRPTHPNQALASIAVSPDGRYVAAVSGDRHSLYVGTLDDATPGVWYTGVNLASPTWDRLDHLWFVAGPPDRQQLVRIGARADGIGRVPGAPATADIGAYGGTVRVIRVAPDGLRMAIVYGASGQQHVNVGLLVSSDYTAAVPSLEFVNGSAVVPDLTTVSTVSWASQRTLAVLGGTQTQAGAAISQVYDDGSAVTSAQVQALTGIIDYSAAANAPMIASSSQGDATYVYQYTDDEVWQRIDVGSMPVYPG